MTKLISVSTTIKSCFIGGVCFVLSGCQPESLAATSPNITTAESPTAIHVESNVKSLVEVNEDQQYRQALVQTLYPDGTSEVLQQFLLEMNEPLLQFLVDQQIEVQILPSLEAYHTDYSISYGTIEGVYLPESNQIICLEQSDEALRNWLNERFYHEVGHVVDTRLGDLAMTEAFRLLYEEGAEQVFPTDQTINDYYRENVWEYFAESFNLFFNNPAQLAKHEETYKYFCSVMEQFSNPL